MLHVGEWMFEEEMPGHHIDGAPMVNGVDINGRAYGVNAAWEGDPQHVDTGYACGICPADANCP